MNTPYSYTLGDKFLALVRRSLPWAELRHESLAPFLKFQSLVSSWKTPATVARVLTGPDGTQLVLTSPLFLAAGANKTAQHLAAFGAAGFGAVTVGTATLRPRVGNPLKPRVHTLEGLGAIQNAMGLNNPGAHVLRQRIEEQRPALERIGLRVGVSVSEDPSLLPDEDGVANVLECLNVVYPCSDYIELNLSCPNTGHERLDQAWDKVAKLLQAVTDFRQAQARKIPIWVKLSPDLSADSLEEALTSIRQAGLTGSVLFNTWPAAVGTWPNGTALPTLSEVGRPGLKGGLSGRPLWERTKTGLVQAVKADPSGAHLACGGIETGAQAGELLAQGAAAIQVYSVLAFRWMASRRIVEELPPTLSPRSNT